MRWSYHHNLRTGVTEVTDCDGVAEKLVFKGKLALHHPYHFTNVGGKVTMWKPSTISGQSLFFASPEVLLHDPERFIFQGVRRPPEPMDTGIKDGRHDRGFSKSPAFRGIFADNPFAELDTAMNKASAEAQQVLEKRMLAEHGPTARKDTLSKEWDLGPTRRSELGVVSQDTEPNWREVRPKGETLKGYHKADIPQGTYGEFSKVEEEFHEAKDALAQGNKVMLAVELSDMLLAIKGFVTKHLPGISFEDLIRQAEATERAFNSGERRSKRAHSPQGVNRGDQSGGPG